MFKVILCILSAILVAECSLPAHITARSELSLGNFLLAQQGLAISPPSAQCFPIYLPLLSEAAHVWSQEHEACLKTAENTRSGILERAKAYHEEISAQAGNVCGYIQSCDAETESVSALDCFGLLSSEISSTIYVISTNASDVVTSLHQEIAAIDSDSYRCSNASERRYVQRSTQIYDALNSCLVNGSPPETTTTGTTLGRVVPLDELHDIKQSAVVAVPRRTPALFALKNQQKEEERIKPASRSSGNTWLDQRGNQGVDNV